MLAADDGDCLVLAWDDAGQERRILFDGGRTGGRRAIPVRNAVLEAERSAFELVVATHIDADHVGGLLGLAQHGPPALAASGIWFNAHRHLVQACDVAQVESFGPVQGDRLAELIAGTSWRWNEATSGGPVAIHPGQPRTFGLAGGMTLTLLSPTFEKLARLRPVWEAEVRAARTRAAARMTRESPADIESFGPLDVKRLAATPDEPDDAVANGTSIAVVAELAGRRLLLAADAHPDLLESSLAALAAAEGGRYRIDLAKVPHHGSRRNTTVNLLRLLQCRRFAFSTNGRHGHPDDITIARILEHCCPGESKEFYFNYRCDAALRWDDPNLQRNYIFRCFYPADGVEGGIDIAVP